LLASGQLALLLQLRPIFQQSYRSSFIAAALSEGIYTMLREGPISLDTLHNNIYYFSIPERLDLLRQLVNFLNPGGKLLVTSACQGFQSTMVLNLSGQMTEGAGALPQPDDLWGLMGQAGLIDLRKTELLPGGGFYAFVGTKV
jgi:4-hydroxy-2,2'-bipyrrole-5-carbaldehyde O-methyltransferase